MNGTSWPTVIDGELVVAGQDVRPGKHVQLALRRQGVKRDVDIVFQHADDQPAGAARRRRCPDLADALAVAAGAAVQDGEVHPPVGGIVVRHFSDQHLDQHLRHRPIQLLDNVVDGFLVLGRGRDDEGIGVDVGDDVNLPLISLIALVRVVLRCGMLRAPSPAFPCRCVHRADADAGTSGLSCEGTATAVALVLRLLRRLLPLPVGVAVLIVLGVGIAKQRSQDCLQVRGLSITKMVDKERILRCGVGVES